MSMTAAYAMVALGIVWAFFNGKTGAFWQMGCWRCGGKTTHKKGCPEADEG